ncbi:hypothetical protein K1Y38_24340 [Serratia marcescens]|uniref:hypothetical protein n=1 Tax=Serratia marcescens TaxID=615 RepID=UPI00223760F6|nr:hypothetical protein [Serratia marcescens]MCW6015899.1 hypothetical protein [Serratia marcescens]MCW6023144.1 hypothetical protein [Serratia marcescens]
MKNANSEKGLSRVNRFITARDFRKARSSQVEGINLAEATSKTLGDVLAWMPAIPTTLPADMRPIAS